MQYRWLVGLVTMTVLAVVLAFALSAHSGTAGSLDQEAENEQTVKIGVTSCGVERWSIKTGTDAGAKLIRICARGHADTRPSACQRIGDDDDRDGFARLRELPLLGRPLLRVGILGDLGPEALERLEGYPAHTIASA